MGDDGTSAQNGIHCHIIVSIIDNEINESTSLMSRDHVNDLSHFLGPDPPFRSSAFFVIVIVIVILVVMVKMKMKMNGTPVSDERLESGLGGSGYEAI